MKVYYTHCAGLDVHKESIHVCIRSGKGKKLTTATAVFGTMTEDLRRMRELLQRHRVRRVVMESTGVYWMPVWNVLDRGSWKFDLVLVNPQHVKSIPGRKTDQQDCERLAELGQYNLLRGSFIPPRDIQELRDLTRMRVQLAGERNRLVNRIGRVLEMANCKLGSVVSDLTGKTGWLILTEIAKGSGNPEKLAELAQGTLRNKKKDLVRSLHGYFTEHFRWLLRQLLSDISGLDERKNELDARIRERMGPHQDVIARLSTIPGVQEITAWTIIAELGTDMSRFPDASHAASWAGLCPGQQESAGKRQSGRTRKGNRYLRRMLVQNSWAVAKQKSGTLRSLFFRVSRRRGAKKAAVAVAHRVLVIAYHILRDGTVFRETEAEADDNRRILRGARRWAEKLERLGFGVVIQPKPEAVAPVKTGVTRWEAKENRGTRASRDWRRQNPLATQEQCQRCARWKIPCIHAKNADFPASKIASPSEEES